MKSPFDILPERFFSPLSSTNRRHYWSALMIFYGKFLDSPTGVERDALVDALETYCVSADFSPDEDESETDSVDARGKARFLLSKILDSGWISEETLQDFTRIVNIEPYAKSFFEALYSTAKEIGTEYESHIVAVYSLLCGEASSYNGHYTVLRAHDHTMRLLDSLKVLSQRIKRHFEIIHQNSAKIPDILRAHYDTYMNEVIDAAYTRLKTNDNLSRYRPKIIERINKFLVDEEWVASTSAKLQTIITIPARLTAGEHLLRMLEDMRESLRAIDPIMDDIDRRNRQYSRISTEKIKNKLYSESSLSGKLISIAQAFVSEKISPGESAHNIFRFRSLSPGSLYNRWRGESVVPISETVIPFRKDDIDEIESRMRRKIELQINAAKIASYLDAALGSHAELPASEIVVDAASFVRILYAAVYAEAAAKKFSFGIEWREGDVSADDGHFVFQDHSFRKKRSTEKEHD